MSSIAYALIGGGFQDGEGKPLSDGILSARLIRACTDLATGTLAICNQTVQYALDDEGNVSTSPLQYIIPSDLLSTDFGEIGLPAATPLDTFYMLQVDDENGQTVWGPNAMFLHSTNATSFTQMDYLAPTGSQTVYHLTYTPLTNSLFVFRNGVFQTIGIDYSLSSATITFFSAPLSSDTVIALYTEASAPSVVLPTFQVQTLTPGSTVYTLSHTPVLKTVTVFQNGEFQSPGIDYNIAGSTITFTTTTYGALYVVYQTAAGIVGTTGQVPSNGTSTASYNLAATPDPESLMLFVNGLFQTPGVNFDYLLNGNQVVFNTTSIPPPGAGLYSVYDVPKAIDLSDFAPNNPA